MGEIERLIGTFNLSAALLLPKALEIERIMRLKVPQGSLKKVELPLEMRQIQIDQIIGRSLSICHCNRFCLSYPSYLNLN
jgi:hypothetical protein